MNNLKLKKKTYVYELPYTERKEICNIIDMANKWEELGEKYMKFDRPTLFNVGNAPMRNKSPTEELLTIWGEQNHRISELFMIFHKMMQYRAMVVLKSLVDVKYHKLLHHGEKGFKIEKVKNVHDEFESVHTFSVDSNQSKVNNLEHKDLNKSAKIKKPDPSTAYSPAEDCTPMITYEELEKITNNWNQDNILGKGGFGMVFKGKWKNTEVAIKRLEPKSGKEIESKIKEAKKELMYLCSFRHDNILPLYGFSIGGENPCLVFQFMSNGSLEDRLQCRNGTEPLTWDIRLKIAKGSARGLQFLHGMDCPLIHGDIKSANILLGLYFEPRIGDFGLAREGPLREYTHKTVTHAYGTLGYLPEEFLRNRQLSTKVDTYSFGVVLFEIATGQKAYDKSKNLKYLKDYIVSTDCPINDIADAKAGPAENNIYRSFVYIGKNCVRISPKDRPEMEQVLEKLDNVMLQGKVNNSSKNTIDASPPTLLIMNTLPQEQSAQNNSTNENSQSYDGVTPEIILYGLQ